LSVRELGHLTVKDAPGGRRLGSLAGRAVVALRLEENRDHDADQHRDHPPAEVADGEAVQYFR